MDKLYSIHLPEPGQSKRLIHPAVRSMPVNIYRPFKVNHKKDVLVAIHGISRNAQQQIDGYRSLADQLGLWLIVPEFREASFPKYQQLAKKNTEPRADLALNTFLLAWQEYQGITGVRVHLCGYSGGAQFAHRYALVYPENLSSLILSSAGWYTFPDNAKYPKGLSRWPTWLRSPKLAEMLSIPLLVIVGDQDVERNKSLNTSSAVDSQQGLTRLERAKNWFQSIMDKRASLGIQASAEFWMLEQQGHDFSQNITQSKMPSHISAFLSLNINSKIGK